MAQGNPFFFNTNLEKYYKNFTVIIPTYNEGENIATLLGLLTGFYPEISIIVADDGSTDDTKKEVEQFNAKGATNCVFLDRSNEAVKGLTASVLDAITHTKTEYFIVMDADLQHPPEYIRLIIEKLLQEFDIVIAIRDDIVRKWTLSRIITQKGAAFLGKTRLILKGIIIKDPMSGFFGGRTLFVRNLINEKEKRFVKQGYKVLFDILKILPEDASIGGIRFEFSRRKKGHSKMNFRIGWLFIKSIFK